MGRVALPVIVETQPGKLFDVFEEMRNYEFRVALKVLDRVLGVVELPIFETRIMPLFNMFAMVLPREIVFDLAEDKRVVKIYSDELKYALQYPTVPLEGVYVLEHRFRGRRVEFTSTYWTKRLMGCDAASMRGFRGGGVKVAVLDTGVSAVHEQLSGRIYKSMTVYPGMYGDLNGHGTWCAACIGGRTVRADAISRVIGRDVLCEGMAQDCMLYAIKVLGFIVGVGCDSAIIKGVEWALQENVKVLSLSLGGAVEVDCQEEDPFHSVMGRAVELGSIPIVAGGNSGPGSQTITSPGWLENVLTVGAFDPISGVVAEYSSRGPTVDGRVKPDVVAPGGGFPDHGIEGAVMGMLDKCGDGFPDGYSPIQGTSMATPHCAGLVALMCEAHDRLLGKPLVLDEVKLMMMKLGHVKSNDDGWGFMNWGIYELWLETEYGVRVA